MKFSAFVLACLMLVVLPASPAVVEIDQPAPALRSTLLSGKPFDLKELRGKVVLVNFYSSYCSFCAYEIGNLETFYERHRDQGFEVVVIGIDSLEDRARVARALTNYGLQGAMADELAESGFERRYPTPTAYVIDRDGIVRSRYRGSKQPAYFANHVLPLLQTK
jgi:peroxiredoxin